MSAARTEIARPKTASTATIVVPLYRRVLGARFDTLAPAVRALHDIHTTVTWRGTADVQRGTNAVARVIATLFRLPAQGHNVALSVTFTPHADGSETWVRRFADRHFPSVQSDAGGGVIAERVGLVTLLLRPDVADGAMTLTLRSARLLGLPLPHLLLPRVATHEQELHGRYQFDVAAHLPLVGLLVRYRGTLSRDA